ncbi:MAG TPA: phage/plasmid primase, P4 family [Planctomycetaceae bacterium]
MATTNSLRQSRRRNKTPAAPPPALQVQVSNVAPITITDLSDVTEDTLAAIGNQVTDVNSDMPIGFVIGDFWAWTDALRGAFFALVASVTAGYFICMSGRDQPRFNDLFEFTLAVAEGPSHVERCGRSRRAAIEAAIICHPNDSETAASRICERFRTLGLSLLPQTISKILKGAPSSEGSSDLLDPARLAAVYQDALRGRVENAASGPVVRYFQDDIYDFNGKIWTPEPPNFVRANVVKVLQEQGIPKITGQLVSNVLLNLQAQTLVQDWKLTPPVFFAREDPPEISSDRHLVFKNGVVNLDQLLNGGEAELLPYDSRIFSTVQLPYDYDRHAECPLLLGTLDEIFPRLNSDDHRIEIVQEFMGLTLIPGDMRHEKCLILDGRGANGKSTLLKVWKALLGKDNVSHISLDHMGGEFRLIVMQHKLANITSEMNRPGRINEAVLKQLITGDPLDVNRKNRSPITMLPSARLIFATNSVPYFADRSDGIFRRMLIVPFLMQFRGVEKDNRRGDRLLDELPGIFNWAILGAQRLLQQNAFTPCSVCDARLNQHRLDSDAFQQFVDEELDFIAGAKIVKQTLYARFAEFCLSSGRKACCKSEMGKLVLQLPGVTDGRESSGRRDRFYTGLRLRDPATPQD